MYHDFGSTHQLAHEEMVTRRAEAEAHRLRRQVPRRHRRSRRSRPAGHAARREPALPRRRYLALFPRG